MNAAITCTSTHCERRQECASPSECTGSAKDAPTYDERVGYETRILAAEMFSVRIMRQMDVARAVRLAAIDLLASLDPDALNPEQLNAWSALSEAIKSDGGQS